MILVTVLLLVALSIFAYPIVKMSFSNVKPVAVISHNFKVIKRVDLSEVTGDQLIDVQGKHKLKIEVQNKRIRVKEANCPDQVCVRTGWLKKPGDTAVCLPEQLIIKIEGNESEVDMMTF